MVSGLLYTTYLVLPFSTSNMFCFVNLKKILMLLLKCKIELWQWAFVCILTYVAQLQDWYNFYIFYLTIVLFCLMFGDQLLWKNMFFFPYHQSSVIGKLSKYIEAILYYWQYLYESLHFTMLLKGRFFERGFWFYKKNAKIPITCIKIGII